MKPIWELENSKDSLERLNFVKRIKEIIELKELDIKILENELGDRITFLEEFKKRHDGDLELLEYANESIDNLRKVSNEEIIVREKSFVKMLKEKLSRFDVYSQESVYRCSVCRQKVENCCCNETGGDDWVKGLDL